MNMIYTIYDEKAVKKLIDITNFVEEETNDETCLHMNVEYIQIGNSRGTICDDCHKLL